MADYGTSLKLHKKRLRFLAMSGLFCLSCELLAAESNLLKFDKNSIQMSAQVNSSVKAVVQSLKSDPTQTIKITSRSRASKKGSLSYLVEEARALSVFRAIVIEGIDPARINIENRETKDSNEIAIDYSRDGFTKTKTIRAENAEIAAGDFTLNFASGSATPLPFDQSRFEAFLKNVGQENKDSIVIEGHTDSIGNAQYNNTLGELRALTVFELLVRNGLPPYRVDAKSIAKSSAPGRGKEVAADRKVVVKWNENSAIAAIAKKEELPPVKVSPAETLVEEKKEARAEVKSEVSEQQTSTIRSSESHLDLVVFGGALLPLGDLQDNAKSAGNYGLGIGKAFLEKSSGSEVRVTLFASAESKLAAKENSRDGDLNFRLVNLRADYIFGGDRFRPYIGLGVGSYYWDATIRLNGTELRNTGSHNDFGGNVILGLSLPLMKSFFVEPEIAFHKISGDFSNSLFDAQLAMRWRL